MKKSFFAILALGATMNAHAAEMSSEKSANLAKAKLFSEIANEATFSLDQLDFSKTSVSDIAPRGGGVLVEAVAVVENVAVICHAKVVLGEDGRVREFTPYGDSICADIR